MKRVELVLVASLGVMALWLWSGAGKAGSDVPARSAWQRSVDNWMAIGGTFRWSAARTGPATAQQIVDALLHDGMMNVSVWQDSWPVDWPPDDRELGPRNRIELGIAIPQEQWLPPEVAVYFVPHARRSDIVGPPPSAAAALARGRALARIASGEV
jgi:hypothetical protein